MRKTGSLPLVMFALAAVAVFCCVHSQDLPFSIPDEHIQPLRKMVDKDLQKRLETRLKQEKSWANLIKRKKMAVGVVDLSDSLNVKFARVNGNIMMYAASLPKLAILLAAEQAIEDGRLEPAPEVLHDMRIMISKSDNPAATRMIERAGDRGRTRS